MRTTDRERGQALVEFSLTIVIFLVLMMAIVDLGRGIYMFNGVAQAAREVARVTSVHPGTGFGNSAETAAVVGTQKKLIPNFSATRPSPASTSMTAPFPWSAASARRPRATESRSPSSLPTSR